MKLSILAATAAVQSMANHELAEGDRVKLTERALKGHHIINQCCHAPIMKANISVAGR
jgi:hypothetical protein